MFVAASLTLTNKPLPAAIFAVIVKLSHLAK
jgi:hypothetical protein